MNTLIEKSVSTSNKTFFLESYGCQMNEYDSGLVKNILSSEGFNLTKEESLANLILINTCAIRENAHDKIYNRLESLLQYKRKNPNLIVGLLGCMAQNLGDDLFAMGLPLDLVVGPDNYRKLPELINEISESYTNKKNKASSLNLTQLSRSETYDDLNANAVNGKLAFITIMRGCDNFCSFCVVPYTRGRERSRDPNSIIKEINDLIKDFDVREITLLGQNVNSYNYNLPPHPHFSENSKTSEYSKTSEFRRNEKSPQHPHFSFVDLVKKILAETNIERIRFTSPHPHDFPEDLIQLMANEERFCSQIHLPLQSGSNKILKAMKRDYTREDFLALVKKMRSLIPELSISTDLIVGFCGEDNNDFEDTVDLIKQVRFDMAYMFRYSERESTYAKKNLKDDVPENVKLERLNKLISVQRKIALEINQTLIGKIYKVLIEGFSKKNRNELMGRTHSGKVIIIPMPESEYSNLDHWIGKTINVKIISTSSAALRGEIVL